MKKLMILAAAIAMSVAVNASTFSWGISSGNLDATTFAGATAYLFYNPNKGSTFALPSTTDWATKTIFTVADLTGNGAAIFDIPDVDPDTPTVEGMGKIADDGTFVSPGYDITKLDNKTGSFKFYMAVITDDGKNVALVTSTKTAMITGAATGAPAKWANTAFKTYTAASGGVPEPTSAMLLLLGVAGLALRRKQA